MMQLWTIYDNVILVSKTSKQTSKSEMKQLQTNYDNVILLSESLQTDIEIENEAITDHFS